MSSLLFTATILCSKPKSSTRSPIVTRKRRENGPEASSSHVTTASKKSSLVKAEAQSATRKATSTATTTPKKRSKEPQEEGTRADSSGRESDVKVEKTMMLTLQQMQVPSTDGSSNGSNVASTDDPSTRDTKSILMRRHEGHPDNKPREFRCRKDLSAPKTSATQSIECSRQLKKLERTQSEELIRSKTMTMEPNKPNASHEPQSSKHSVDMAVENTVRSPSPLHPQSPFRSGDNSVIEKTSQASSHETQSPCRSGHSMDSLTEKSTAVKTVYSTTSTISFPEIL
ncbi:hypothetical protein L596_024931 [Steinernema carpocapsae]|uniref:Uncharacterized protein n=1 Tax=Steinernema carpocapsae TaxID=34508 RepID=A0A4V5ZYN2_STECR|nr:hypothetical protein L596_024931 [Steinernema carpocapsae]